MEKIDISFSVITLLCIFLGLVALYIKSLQDPAKELPLGEYIKVNGRYYKSGTPYMKDQAMEVIDDYGVKWKVDKMLFNDTRN